jgi:hypothetical protein
MNINSYSYFDEKCHGENLEAMLGQCGEMKQMEKFQTLKVATSSVGAGSYFWLNTFNQKGIE